MIRCRLNSEKYHEMSSIKSKRNPHFFSSRVIVCLDSFLYLRSGIDLPLKEELLRGHFMTFVPCVFLAIEQVGPEACFSKVPKLFGSISGATIPVISSQRQGSKPSNFAVLLVFLTLKACLKISCSKQADCSLTTRFSSSKTSRDFLFYIYCYKYNMQSSLVS